MMISRYTHFRHDGFGAFRSRDDLKGHPASLPRRLGDLVSPLARDPTRKTWASPALSRMPGTERERSGTPSGSQRSNAAAQRLR